MAGLVLAGASNAAAQTQATARGPVTARVPVTMEEPNLPRQEGAILLNLEDAIELAVRRNLGLVIERYVRTQSELGIQQALGIYDTLLTARADASDATNPTVDVLTASSASGQSLNVGVSQFIPTGGQFSLGFESSRSESTNNRINPAYDSGLTFNLEQPLLRDFGAVVYERQLLIARNQNAGSAQEFTRQVYAILQQVTDAYWNLVESREQLNVARQSLALAQELHERNRIQVEVGTMAPLELVQSEANIATNEEEIIRTETLVGDAEDELRRLLNLPQGELWQAEIRPATDPASENVPVDLDTAIRQALDTRPEIQAQRLQIDLARAELGYFQNQTLPSLDLRLNYGLSGSNAIVTGLNAEGRPVVGAGSYGESLDQITGFDFDGWTASLIFGFPLQNRTARAQRSIAELDLELAETTLEQLEQSVITEVRQATRRVDSAAKQIDAARASVRFQERSLDAERKRYENGMSSSFEITRIQQDLTAARSREVSAIIAYRTAVTQLQRVTGQLLSTYGLAIDDPDADVRRWSFFGRRF
jgi:outer membrane protein